MGVHCARLWEKERGIDEAARVARVKHERDLE